MFAKAKGSGVFIQDRNACQTAHFIEKVVAGDIDGVHHIDGAVSAPVGVIDPAGRLIGGGVIGVAAQRLDLLGWGNDAALQCSHCCQRLEGGAGRIRTLSGAVQHGIGRVGHQFVEILIISGQMKGRIGGQRQHRTGAHLYHGGAGAAFFVSILLAHAGNGGGQRFFHSLLEVQINGQLYGAAGLRLLGVVLLRDFTVAVGGIHLLAVAALQIGLESGLSTGAADDIVVGVALLLQLLCIILNAAHRAQNMRRIVGFVFTGGGGENAGTQIAAVLDQSQQSGIQIPQHNVIGGVDQLTDGQLVEDAQYIPGVLCGPCIGDGKCRSHFRHQHIGGETGGGQCLCRQIGGGHSGGDQLQLFPQEGDETAALCGTCLLQQIGIRPCPGNGQVVLPLQTLFAQQLHQPQDGGVQVIILTQRSGIKGQVVGLAVANQFLTVPVGDDAPGGFHRAGFGDGMHRLGQILLAVGDLCIIQNGGKCHQHSQKEAQQGADASAIQFRGFLFKHGEPPVRVAKRGDQSYT